MKNVVWVDVNCQRCGQPMSVPSDEIHKIPICCDSYGESNVRFRKRPIVIDAFEWWPATLFPKGFEGLHSVARLTGPSGRVTPSDDRQLIIKTLEGDHAANPGDWIIKGVKGEFYPCKPDIFAITYEAVK